MVEKQMSLVSVAVITYNSSKYVIETLESIKAQTYQNIELIISDDCSTDNTVQMCKKWCEQNKERFARIQYVEVEQNTGVSANCNRAEDACQGEWVKLIAGDDILKSNCIQEYMNYCEKQNDVIYVFSHAEIFGSTAEKHDYFDKKVFKYDFFSWSVDKQYQYLIQNGNCIPAATAFYNLNKVRQLGIRYDERIPMVEDLPRWINLLRKNIRFYFIDKKLVKYRHRGTSLSNSHCQSKIYYKSCRLYDFYYVYKDCDLSEPMMEQIIDDEYDLYVKKCEYQDKYYNILQSNAFKLGTTLLQPIYCLKRLVKDEE